MEIFSTPKQRADRAADESEMLEIPGIDPDKVRRYGKNFLRLIRESQNRYETLMHLKEDCPEDHNHKIVIEITSGDEFADDGGFDDFVEDGPQEERSAYFQVAPDVDAFNARCECFSFGYFLNSSTLS